MVGKVFRVLFTRGAQRRRNIVDDFETKKSGKRRANKVQQAIDDAADRLEKGRSSDLSQIFDIK